MAIVYDISEKLKTIWVRNPKAGQNSVVDALQGKGFVRIQWPQDCGINGKDFEVERSFFRFMICRNPFDKTASCYQYFKNRGKVRPEVSFEEFVIHYLLGEGYDHSDKHQRGIKVHLRPQAKLDQFVGMDYVAKLENIKEDWKYIMDKTGLPPLPHYNKSHKKSLDYYYTPGAEEIVREYYRNDFKKFGYEDTL